VSLSALNTGVKELREVIAESGDLLTPVVFIDEIHRFNKSQQEPEQAEFISFSASTRISGVNLPNGEQIRKGALDAILKFVD
ncbi:hypothetical protein, partial [Acinetobacter nosocomialis]|uniref:hypothetical protein n=1 Tax=Acinetobacter nosocomialis TaxID=106654 RepID=UPI00124F4F60